MSLPPLDTLLLRTGAVLLAYAIGALTLAHRWAKAGDQRLWSES